jgi:branched-chain amino acid transport system permease protein
MDIPSFIVSIMTWYGIYALLSLSLNLELGYTGIPNFGKVAFFGIGAIASGALTSRLMLALAGMPIDISSRGALFKAGDLITQTPLTFPLFLFSILVGAAVAAVFGYLSSYPAIRLRADFLAITLLAFGEVVRIIARTNESIINGPYGVIGIPNPYRIFGGFQTSLLYVATIWIIVAFVFLFIYKLINSPYGRVLKAIREDELAAESLGKDVVKIKQRVMIIGSAIAGMAGAIYIHHTGSVQADTFVPLITIYVWVMVMMGGRGSYMGAIVGTGLFVIMDQLLLAIATSYQEILFIDLNYLKQIIFILILIFVIMRMPRGMVREKTIKTPALSLVKEELSRARSGEGS